MFQKQLVSINCPVNFSFSGRYTRSRDQRKIIICLQGFPASVTYSPPKMAATTGAHFLNITKLRREDKTNLRLSLASTADTDAKKTATIKKYYWSNIKASFLPNPKKTTGPPL